MMLALKKESSDTLKSSNDLMDNDHYDDDDNSPLHMGISLRSVLKGTLSVSLSVTLADESWKSPLIEDKKYN